MQWFSIDSLVSSTTYNWVVAISEISIFQILLFIYLIFYSSIYYYLFFGGEGKEREKLSYHLHDLGMKRLN